MLEWSFGFWQMLCMLFCAYYVGGFVTEVGFARRALDAKNIKEIVVPITIELIDDMLYAFDETTKKFLVQSTTYEDLQKQLSELNADVSCNVVYVTDRESLENLLKTVK